jgi:hypothetical protein
MPKTGKVCRSEGKGNHRGWAGWFILAIHYCAGERLFPGRGPRYNDSVLSFGKKAVEVMFAGEVDSASLTETPIVLNSLMRDDFAVFATFAYRGIP